MIYSTGSRSQKEGDPSHASPSAFITVPRSWGVLLVDLSLTSLRREKGKTTLSGDVFGSRGRNRIITIVVFLCTCSTQLWLKAGRNRIA